MEIWKKFLYLSNLVKEGNEHDQLCSPTLNSYCTCIKFGIMFTDYDNTPMQYSAIFHGRKNGNFQMKNCDILFLFFLKTYIVGIR